jgi:hypothetical protein
MKMTSHLVLFLLMGCGGVRPNPIPDSDPDDCLAACQNLERLKCPGYEGSPGPDEQYGTADDESCELICKSIVKEPGFSVFPSCTAKAQSCDEVDACFAWG